MPTATTVESFTTRCPSCGESNRVPAASVNAVVRCRRCQQRFRAVSDAPPSPYAPVTATPLCPDCGTLLPPKAVFCPGCRFDLVKGTPRAGAIPRPSARGTRARRRYAVIVALIWTAVFLFIGTGNPLTPGTWLVALGLPWFFAGTFEVFRAAWREDSYHILRIVISPRYFFYYITSRAHDIGIGTPMWIGGALMIAAGCFLKALGH